MAARRVYSVGQVNSYIKNLFSTDFLLRSVSVRGEVSGCKYHSSQHIYFTLKDETGTLSAVMFSGQRAGLRFKLETGQKVIVDGTVSVYERDGKYQLYARRIELDGAGDLYRRFEELKRSLEEMGMFDQSYKQPIPPYAARVGVVTASSGAAIRDIVNVTHRRNPYVQLVLAPAQVQGEGAADSIAAAIERLDGLGLDVLIVGRGGGSMEDLWAFNEEKVARAIFDCDTPVISAVGHETDFTIADFVADLRAPTPSAAAELAVFSAGEFFERTDGLRRRLTRDMQAVIHEKRLAVGRSARRLEAASPRQRLYARSMELAELRRELDDALGQSARSSKELLRDAARRMRQASERRMTLAKNSLSVKAAKLEGLSPLKRLRQGWAYVTDDAGHNVKSVAAVAVGDRLTIELADGRLRARAEEVANLGQD